MSAKKIFEQELKKNGYSLTNQRLIVFDLLNEANRPLAISEVHQKLPSLDKVTIYRTIDLFIKLGFAKRVWQGLKSKVELTDIFLPHHHHIICLKCQKVQSFSSPKLEEYLDNYSKKIGFDMKSHELEINGLCRDCKNKR